MAEVGTLPRVEVAIGDRVLVRAAPARNNGSDVAVADVVRVKDEPGPNGGPVVNVRVLLDSKDIDWRGPVELFATQDEADQAVPARTNTLVGWLRPAR